jgi:hypothetical protein
MDENNFEEKIDGFNTNHRTSHDNNLNNPRRHSKFEPVVDEILDDVEKYIKKMTRLGFHIQQTICTFEEFRNNVTIFVTSHILIEKSYCIDAFVFTPSICDYKLLENFNRVVKHENIDGPVKGKYPHKTKVKHELIAESVKVIREKYHHKNDLKPFSLLSFEISWFNENTLKNTLLIFSNSYSYNEYRIYKSSLKTKRENGDLLQFKSLKNDTDKSNYHAMKAHNFFKINL